MHDSLPERIAFIDLETTGAYPPLAEIIELGAVIVETSTLNVADRLDLKIQPRHIETATAEALKVNGYSPEKWHNAIPLEEAMRQYADRTKGVATAAWRVAFDFPFVQAAMYEFGLLVPGEQTTQLCVYSMALQALRHEPLENFRLRTVSKFLGIPPEPYPHRAINGAEQAFEVYKKLITRP